VGTVPAGWQVKLASDGEVLVNSPDLFECYWNNPEATRAIKGDDGWLRTGDVGEWRGGALRLVDRARDFIVTSGGKTISPSFIENILRTSPYVAEAIVFGHDRNISPPSSRSRPIQWRTGRAATMCLTRASPALRAVPMWCG
jgi:long-chain acyl-CoA synthetase